MMKRMIALLMMCAMMLSMTACADGETPQAPAANEPHAEAQTAQTQSGSILVAYFSLAGEQYEVGVIEKGNTEIVAEMIADATGAELFSIQPVTPYPTTYDGKLEISQQESPETPPAIAEAVENIDRYDTVFIGYPIWWGDMPAIVAGFLKSYDFSGKTVIPFATHAGSGMGGSQRSIEAFAPNAQVLDGLAIRGETAQNDPDTAREEVNAWLTELGLLPQA